MTKPAFVTEKGIELYLDDVMVKLLNKRIKQLNLKNVQAFLAIHPDGYKEYLVVKDNEPYYANQRVEDVESRIEVLALAQNWLSGDK